ncbi:MAG: peptidoglycan peptidase [Hyphomicrobium sp.]|nr:peptidoglycan peptidase [Hyphomicrobium sp.]
MKRASRIFGIFALAVIGLSAAVIAWLAATTVSAADLPPLKTGDIVFQDSGGGQGLAIMLASRSPYTHTGLIEIAPDGTPLVVEAVGPVRTIPLDRWIANGTARRITIKRVKGLTSAAAQSAIARAHTYDGYPYDIYFHDSRDAIYCSELVYAAFKEGPNISVGRVEKIRDLAINNSPTRSLIEARWQRYPPCQAKGIASFDACFQVILEQTLVTPASIARHPALELVYSNFGPAGD